MKRNTLILLGVFVVLVLIVLVGERPFRGREPSDAPRLFPAFDSSAVAAVDILTPSDTTRLEKVDATWRVITADGYPADAKAVGDLLARVRDLRKEEVASRNPEKQSVFEVDGSGLETRLYGPNEEKIAHLYVGKAGPSYSGAYIRAGDSDEVILATGYLKGVFEKGDRGWRDRTLFDFDQADITQFTFEKPGTTLTVSTPDRIRWYVHGPDSCEVKMNIADNILRTISTLQADGFAPEASLEEAGLADPWGTFTARLSDGTEKVLLVGDKDEHEYWAKRPDREMVFKIRDFRVQTLFPTLDILRAPEPEEEEE